METEWTLPGSPVEVVEAPADDRIAQAATALAAGERHRARRLVFQAMALTPENPQVYALLAKLASSPTAREAYDQLALAYGGVVSVPLLPVAAPPAPPAEVGPAIAAEPHPGLRWAILIGYLAGLTAAEAITTFTHPTVGLGLHGLMLVALLMHGALWAHGPERRLLLVLAIAPLIRILSYALPLPEFPLVYWYALVGGPLLLSAWFTARANGLTRAEIGLQPGRAWPLQAVVAVAGIGLGYVEYQILRPEPLAGSLTLTELWLPALILLVFTGLLEEVVFRGLMQRVCIESLGHWPGILYVATLFAVLHLGYRSALDVLFVFAVGLAFGVVAERSRSLWGVTLAHGLTNITLFLVWPFVGA